MEVVACNLCGSARHTPVYEMPDRHYFPDEFFTVVECDECGLGFVNPRPSLDEMQKYYPSNYYEEFSRNYNQHLKRYAAEAEYLREIEKRERPWNLLDVGCASGDFPRFMKARGWNVEGVEVSASAQPIQDFKVYAQQFQEIPVNEPTYDAVTAWAVLEHVHDPMAYFLKASVVTKKHGLFVFLVTNFESLASRHLFCEDIPRHLYFFTRETVRQYLGRTGFRLEKSDYRDNIYGMSPVNWLQFFVKSRIKGKNFAYRDLPSGRAEFLKLHNLKAGALSTLRFVVHEPATALWNGLSRTLLPVVEAIQILRKTYGISTFVARKL
jgi:SAM-dependent methyltransferase